MGFGEAISTGFNHYADFSGRASRPAYWWWALFAFIVGVVTSILDLMFGTRVIDEGAASSFGVLTSLAYLALLLPSWAVAVRRLHDTNHSGWWLLLSLIPFLGAIILIILLVQPSTPGANRYGPPPSGV